MRRTTWDVRSIMDKTNKKGISREIILLLIVILVVAAILIYLIYYDIRPAMYAYIDRTFG